ncbi:gamma-glutamyl-gamma-aminobutyrate hydrolase family protein [Rhodobacteraceae bacterium DSL-40]|uniref:type 1 glutamine amidotransferase n=1 Tax=Amaricoccus sp. B4 TaxID=3368557 RepID=UPI000DAF06B9
MKIGILETGEVRPELQGRHGGYPAMFERLLGAVDPDLEFITVRVVAGEMPASLHDADAWLVTGSRHGVYDGLAWIEPLKAFLRAAVEARVPVVGICFGHQILAEALGGRAEKSAAGWRLGVEDYRLTARPAWLEGLPEQFAMRAVHQDQVTRLPEGAHVIAGSELCPYAVLAYGPLEAPDAITIQPHPEFDAAYLDELIALGTGAVFPAPLATSARASLSRPVSNDAWARLIVGYLREAIVARAGRAPAAQNGIGLPR